MSVQEVMTQPRLKLQLLSRHSDIVETTFESSLFVVTMGAWSFAKPAFSESMCLRIGFGEIYRTQMEQPKFRDLGVNHCFLSIPFIIFLYLVGSIPLISWSLQYINFLQSFTSINPLNVDHLWVSMIMVSSCPDRCLCLPLLHVPQQRVSPKWWDMVSPGFLVQTAATSRTSLEICQSVGIQSWMIPGIRAKKPIGSYRPIIFPNHVTNRVPIHHHFDHFQSASPDVMQLGPLGPYADCGEVSSVTCTGECWSYPYCCGMIQLGQLVSMYGIPRYESSLAAGSRWKPYINCQKGMERYGFLEYFFNSSIGTRFSSSWNLDCLQRDVFLK